MQWCLCSPHKQLPEWWFPYWETYVISLIYIDLQLLYMRIDLAHNVIWVIYSGKHKYELPFIGYLVHTLNWPSKLRTIEVILAVLNLKCLCWLVTLIFQYGHLVPKDGKKMVHKFPQLTKFMSIYCSVEVTSRWDF